MKSHLLRTVPALAAPFIRRIPIRSWPAGLGKLYGIKVPRSVVPNPVRSPAGPANINIILTLLEQSQGLEGDVAECGIFRGATLIPLGLYLQQHGVRKRLLGFDSFQGFDDAVAIDRALGGQEDIEKRVGGFGNTSYEEVERKIAMFHLDRTIQLAKGYFKDTLPRFANYRFCFAHLDCDIYQSYKETLEFFYPRMTPGAIILLDEYNDPPWPGCNRAVDEFLTDKPERLVEIESDNYRKWYLRKQ